MLGSDGSDDSTDGLPSESEGSDHPLYGATLRRNTPRMGNQHQRQGDDYGCDHPYR